MPDFNEDMKLIKDYISQNLNDLSTSYIINESLSKFCQFLADKPVELITDLNLINDNPILLRLLNSFFNHNKSLILDGALEQYFSDPILIQLVDNYYTISKIDIDEINKVDKEANFNGDMITLLLSDISKYPVLNHEQMMELFKDLENNISGTFEKLVNCNLRLVVSIAKRYANYGMDFIDVFQEGTIGLMEAVKRFDYTRGTHFSTFATWWIRQSITRELANKAETIRLPVHLVEGTNKVTRAEITLAMSLNREPTIEEVAVKTGFTKKQVKNLKDLTYTRKNLISLNDRSSDMDKGEFGDFIPAPDTLEEDVDRIMLKEEINKAFEKVNLSEREEDIIRRRFGLEPYRYPQTLQEVADYYHLTGEGIRVVQNTVLRKLKNYLTFVKSANEHKQGILNNGKRTSQKRKDIYSNFESEDIGLVFNAIESLEAWDKEIIRRHDSGISISFSERAIYYEIIIPYVKDYVEKERHKKLNSEFDMDLLLRMLRDPIYKPITARLSVTGSIIVFMSQGFVHNVFYTIPQISELLKIPEEDVKENLKTALNNYKDLIDRLYVETQKPYILSKRKKKKN